MVAEQWPAPCCPCTTAPCMPPEIPCFRVIVLYQHFRQLEKLWGGSCCSPHAPPVVVPSTEGAGRYARASQPSRPGPLPCPLLPSFLQAATAIQALNGASFHGNQLVVKFADADVQPRVESGRQPSEWW